MFYFFKNRGERERITVYTMIRMYCRAHHGKKELCDSCREVAEYAGLRNEKCMFGTNKPVCEKCRVHCYKPHYRERIKEMMRYSGPRMIIVHPMMAIDHLVMKMKKHPDVVFVKRKKIFIPNPKS